MDKRFLKKTHFFSNEKKSMKKETIITFHCPNTNLTYEEKSYTSLSSRKLRKWVIGNLIKYGCGYFVFYKLESLLYDEDVVLSEKEREELRKDLVFANKLFTSDV